jgi:hypothetical protein
MPAPRPPARQALHAFRTLYRREIVPARYSAAAHVALVATFGLGGIAAALVLAARSWRPADFWIVPVTLLVANAVEYLAHRGPMHHRVKGLRAVHTRHFGRHHRFFVADAMVFESARDLHAVLFPPVLLLFFGAIAIGLGALVALFLPRAAAALFVATALAYYLLYETLHFLYHVPPHWRLARLAGVRQLAGLHRLHHDARRMQHCNFNLVFPLFDRLAGTLDAGRPSEPCAPGAPDASTAPAALDPPGGLR